MKKIRFQLYSLICVPVLIVFLAGCNAVPQEEQPGDEHLADITSIQTAQELETFFKEGGAQAQLHADIDLGGIMLKLEQGRGKITLQGNGHTITGDAPCMIRLDQGSSIVLQSITLNAQKTGLGLLGSGEITAQDCVINARGDAIQAAGALRITAGSTLELRSNEGSGILSAGLTLEDGGTLTISGEVYAVSVGRGTIVLEENAKATCEARGDNAVKTDNTLALLAGSQFTAKNTGEHNAARIGTLEAAPDATLQLTGGINGIGLFVVEQYEDVTLHGFSTPEVRVEIGKGEITFN